MDPKRNRIPGDDYRHLTNNESDRNVDEPFVLHHGDCREILAGMPDASIDAVVTDPPYGLEFMGKEWDRPWAVSAENSVGYEGRDALRLPSHRDNRNANCRACGGRQRGKKRCSCEVPKWDRHPAEDMRAFQLWCEQWASEVLRVLKPGGYLLAFGGTRTYHRMACAIEDAGFEIRDSINWTFGSGFPKSLNVGKAIDKMGGADSARWSGYGTALKPAHEPIVVARKPLVGTVAANVLEYGTGALNIDGCRVGTTDSLGGGAETVTRSDQKGNDGWTRPCMDDEAWQQQHAATVRANVQKAESMGRWPANIVLTHHVDCRPTGTTEETVGGGEAGTSGFAAGYESGDGFVGRTIGATVWNCHPECPAAVMDGQSGDSGGASRYFTQTAWDDELDGWSFLYQAKANKRERNAGLDDTEGKTIGAKGNGLARTCATCGASVIDGCDCPDRTYVNPVRKNFHPTVKPVELMRWLVRMVTPPDGTVLDPFTGSGTTGIAATLEGFHFIGIEQDADYIEQIARPRIRHHLHTTLDYATVLEPTTKPDDPQPVNPSDDQPTLF